MAIKRVYTKRERERKRMKKEEREKEREEKRKREGERMGEVRKRGSGKIPNFVNC